MFISRFPWWRKKGKESELAVKDGAICLLLLACFITRRLRHGMGGGDGRALLGIPLQQHRAGEGVSFLLTYLLTHDRSQMAFARDRGLWFGILTCCAADLWMALRCCCWFLLLMNLGNFAHTNFCCICGLAFCALLGECVLIEEL